MSAHGVNDRQICRDRYGPAGRAHALRSRVPADVPPGRLPGERAPFCGECIMCAACTYAFNRRGRTAFCRRRGQCDRLSAPRVACRRSADAPHSRPRFARCGVIVRPVNEAASGDVSGGRGISQTFRSVGKKPGPLKGGSRVKSL